VAAMRENIGLWCERLADTGPAEVLAWATEEFSGKVVLASSMGLEDQVLLGMIAERQLSIPVFTLDTGRLFPETLDLIPRTEKRYGIRIHVFYPDRDAVEDLVNTHGLGVHRKSIALRHDCCGVRKLEPLERALAGRSAWVCGLRSGQAAARSAVDVLEWDESCDMLKINPLAGWSEDDVRTYVREHDVPYNPLHDAGFPSIGCACCTRAVEAGEDIRSGRWWWEEPEQRECGLHVRTVDGKVVYERREQE